MKTTLEIDDALLIEAKVVATRRRPTLRALVEQALPREIQPLTTDNRPPTADECAPLPGGTGGCFLIP